MKSLTISTIMVIIILSSCTPDLFLLNRQSDHILAGKIMTEYGTAESIWENAVILRPGARVAIKDEGVTQLISDFTVRMSKGTGLRFAIRSVDNKFEEHQSLVFDYTIEGSSLRENGKMLRQDRSVVAKADKLTRIIIENDGKYVIIKVDCKTVFFAPTSLPATEYIIIETMPDTESFLSGIEFADILEETGNLLDILEGEISEPIYISK